ncbi:MAG: NB-ARC domain-containing protein [Cyanobacteria bacterium P01_G01_bin.49]
MQLEEKGVQKFIQAIASEYSISRAEQEALTLAAEGYDIVAIAQQLGVNPSSIRQRFSQLYQKFEIEGKGPVKFTKLQQLILSLYQQYQTPNSSNSISSLTQGKCIYLDSAPAAEVFYGRKKELQTLKQWIVGDECRLIALLGMAGIGKSCLAVKLARQLQHKFDYVIWRSLRYTPTLSEFLTELISILSQQQETELPDNTGHQILQLMKHLQSVHCLLIIDDVQTIMESQKLAGHYYKEYENYRYLFQTIGESSHQSCLLLNSREKPREITSLEGLALPVRSLQIGSLEVDAKKIVTSAKKLTVSEEYLTKLIQLYSGNPAALKIVTTTIQELFNGDLVEYLRSDELFIGDILEKTLKEQFQRLSEGETKIMYWLAINDKPLALNEMKCQFMFHGENPDILSIIESLLRRSLIEKQTNSEKVEFTLIPILRKYVINQLRDTIYKAITTEDSQSLDIELVKEGLLKQIKAQIKINNLDETSSSSLYRKIAKVLNILGYETYINKDLATAKFYLLLAIKFQSDRSAPHYNLGSLYEDIGEIQLAKQHYQQAATRDNRAGYAATNNLARLEILEGNYTVAIEMMIQVIEQVEDNDIKATLSQNIREVADLLKQEKSNENQQYLRNLIEKNSSNKFISDLLEPINSKKNQIKINKNSQKSSSYSSSNPRNTPDILFLRNKFKRVEVTIAA